MADEVKPYTPDQMRFGEFSLVFFGVSAEGPIQPDSVYAKRIASLLATARAGLADSERLDWLNASDHPRKGTRRIRITRAAIDAARGVRPARAGNEDAPASLRSAELLTRAEITVIEQRLRAGTYDSLDIDALMTQVLDAEQLRGKGEVLPPAAPERSAGGVHSEGTPTTEADRCSKCGHPLNIESGTSGREYGVCPQCNPVASVAGTSPEAMTDADLEWLLNSVNMQSREGSAYASIAWQRWDQLVVRLATEKEILDALDAIGYKAAVGFLRGWFAARNEVTRPQDVQSRVHTPAPTEPIDTILRMRLVSLLEAMRDNEPDDYAADAVTCWMLWKYEAKSLLRQLQSGASAPAKEGA